MSLNRKTATGREVLASNGDVLVGGRDYEVYSENETMIGYWINKKPLYRRTFNLTAPNNTNEEVAIYTGLDSSIDLVTNFYGIIGSNSSAATNSWYAINHIGTSSTTTEATVSRCHIRVDLTNREICCVVNNSKRTSAPLYITLEYTKSTDSAIVDTNTYSTEEKLIGETWIDGKPIYRKYFSGTTSNTIRTWADIYINLSIDSIIKVNGIITDIDGNRWDINSFRNNANLDVAQTCVWSIDPSGNVFRILTAGNTFLNCPIYGWIEYTKTT